jgi:quercetin dioxygenase-like cupin family protein
MRRRFSLKYRSTVLFAIVAAISVLSFEDVRTTRAQQTNEQTSSFDADMPDANRGKQGITHTALLRSDLAKITGQEVIVWDTEYAPRAINPRHYHPAAITFHIVSGTGVFQEEGKPSVTLHAGDSLFIRAGTVHAHWNPSRTENLRFLEFIVGEKDKARPEPRPRVN